MGFKVVSILYICPMEKGKTAIVIGATGLVGSHLLQDLLKDKYFDKVIVLSRRTTGIKDGKLTEHIVNFDDVSSYQKLVKGDVLFSCMGTTIKKAGSKDAQWKIDYTYQLEVAEAARKNEVSSMVLVSSSGASSKSRIFYSRMKGELEEAIRKLNFSNYLIFQPSLLVGPRTEVRRGEQWGEKIAKVLMKVLPPLRKYKPIHGAEVAQAMINAYKKEEYNGESVFVLDEIFKLLRD